MLEEKSPSWSAWAKSSKDRQHWLPVWRHAQDAARTAEMLFDDWLAPGQRELWGECFPGRLSDARAAITWIAGLHDVGKISPAFAIQVGYLLEPMKANGFACGTPEELAERRKIPHTLMGQYAFRQWARCQDRLSRTTAKQLGSIIGAHHGRPAEPGQDDNDVPGYPWLTGGDEWVAARRTLIDWVTEWLGVTSRLHTWHDIKVPLPVQVLMSGLVIMADWIVSNERFFPYIPLDDVSGPVPNRDQEARDRSAWADLAVPPPWAPSLPDQRGVELYRERFGWPEHFRLNAVQSYVESTLRTCDAGLVIVEATTGSGKTEAALVAAELMAVRSGASGVFVALPTQATADGMFDRVVPWLDRLPEPSPDAPAWAITLTHGKARLNQVWSGFIDAADEVDHAFQTGDLEQIHDDDEPRDDALSSVAAHAWFRGRKRALLSNFAVGTIDQLLMAGIGSKHLMLRHLAFAGKVVIIDEAHAADFHMQVYLDRVLGWLGHYRVPVVILSATLPAVRREQMVSAYLGERAADDGILDAVRQAGDAYPLVTVVDRDLQHVEMHLCPSDTAPAQIGWSFHPGELASLVERLGNELRDGGCALVIRNTVGSAQATAAAIAEAGIAPVTLTHSRFLAADRAAIDIDLRRRFGPDATSRPRSHVVVATQVAEQSLDVDFDFLVSDLAPLDLLFQRMGRLHRHGWRRRPPPLAAARCVILTDPETNATPPFADRGTRAVYPDHLLLRTALFLGHLDRPLTIPDDVAPGVHAVYSDVDLGGAEDLLADARDRYHAQRSRQQERAAAHCIDPWQPSDTRRDLTRWLRSFDDGSERVAQATVRDIQPTLEVIVVPTDVAGLVAISPPWQTDPVSLDTHSKPDDDTARRVASWSVKLPPALTRNPQHLTRLIDWLEHDPAVRRWHWHRHPVLAGELFLPMRQTSEGSMTVETTIPTEITGRQVRLRYTIERGLEVVDDA